MGGLVFSRRPPAPALGRQIHGPRTGLRITRSVRIRSRISTGSPFSDRPYTGCCDTGHRTEDDQNAAVTLSPPPQAEEVAGHATDPGRGGPGDIVGLPQPQRDRDLAPPGTARLRATTNEQAGRARTGPRTSRVRRGPARPAGSPWVTFSTPAHPDQRIRRGLRLIQYRSHLMDGCLAETDRTIGPA